MLQPNNESYYQKNKERLAEYQRQWRANHPNKYKEYWHKYRITHTPQRLQYNKEWVKLHPNVYKNYYQKHKTTRFEYNKQWRRNNPDKIHAYHEVATIKRKREIISHYSNGKMECVMCGMNNIDCLSIDHINGGGARHRKDIKKQGVGFYSWLKTNGYPEGYQVLCMNCQFIKKANDRKERGGTRP